MYFSSKIAAKEAFLFYVFLLPPPSPLRRRGRIQERIIGLKLVSDTIGAEI
jgi:hypothetical protein